MVKIVQKQDGYYILEAQIDGLTIVKGLMDADKPLEKIAKEPKADGFYLHIPDEIICK